MEQASDGVVEGVTLSDLLLSTAPNLRNNSVAATDYMAQALRLPLSVLEAEPLKLTELSTQLDGDLSSLCYRSYPAFILAHDCTNALLKSFTDLDTGLDGFLEASQSLNRSCKEFQTAVEPTMEVRTRIAAILDHVDAIEELLDLPRLVGTCVRTGQWQTAMDLARKVADFEQRMAHVPSRTPVGQTISATEHRPDENRGHRVMRNICKAVESEMVNLKSRILDTLKERSLKLPGAVRAINMLRKLDAASYSDALNAETPLDDEDVSSEEVLQLMLLTSRWECFTTQIEALTSATSFTAIEGASSDDRARFIKRYIEIWREIVGDAVTMYTEIFLAEDSGVKDALTLKRVRKPLVLFLHHSLNTLLAMLESHLPHVNTVSSIATLSTQLTYCATAFTRFGFDFRQHVTTLIQGRVKDLVISRFEQGLADFRSELAPLSSRKTTFETILLAPESMAKVNALELPPIKGGNLLSHQPPAQLTLFPPLARFVNAVAAALNELRLSPANSIWPALREALTSTLFQATGVLLAVVEDALPLSTPRLANTNDSDDEEPLDKNARLKYESERRTVCTAVTAFFGRGVLPWCEGALRKGVYVDLPSAQSRGEDTGVKQAREKCESILVRIAAG